MDEDHEADIYLIGESHSSEQHAEHEEAAIRQMKPRYVLSEGASRDPEQAQRETEKAGRNYTLGRTDDAVKDHFSDYGGAIEQVEDEIMAYCRRRREEDAGDGSDGLIPSDREELYQTAWPDLDQDVIRKVQEAVTDEMLDEMDEYQRFSSDDADPMDDQRIQTLKAVRTNLEKYIGRKADSKSSASYRIRAAIHDLQQEGHQTELRGMDLEKEDTLEGDRDTVRERLTSAEFSDEREDEMAQSIAAAREEGGERVMAIMGRSHLEGVRERLEAQGYTVAVDALDDEDDGASMAYSKKMLDRYTTEDG